MSLVQVQSSSSVSGLCLVFLYLILFQTQIVSSALVLSYRNQHNKNQSLKKKPFFHNQTSCNIFVGTWVHDDALPIYQSSHCPTIDPQFNCQMYGRPDSDYQRYQWRPDNCQLPRFDGQEFLVRMRGRSVMFVGDSLGRNQWESLICMISTAVPYTATQMIRGEILSRFNFLDYGITLSYYKALYLVDIDEVEGKQILKLDEISSNAEAWKGVDVLMFNSGHWWIHTGGLQGWDYMESGGVRYSDMDRLAAFERGMRTWSRWVDKNIDRTRIGVFLQSISPTHYIPSEWNGAARSKNCYGESAPVSGNNYPGPYPDQMKVVKAVLRDMKIPANLLDITTLSELRKDAHPSIYSGDLSPDQRANPDSSADCSHWCLPGLPDTWNQLFYTALFF